MKRFARILAIVLAGFLVAPAAEAPRKPKLVVAIVIDQFRYDYLLRFKDDYKGGLARLLQNGAVFTDAAYVHAATVTAVGHSTFLTGATPSVSGIIGNEWYDRESGRSVTSVSDPNAKLVGGNPGATGASPRRLLVDTIGDELRVREGDKIKVIGVSLKDRSAILPAGHAADGAYWFDDASHNWVTSDYYMSALPAWAAKVNALRPSERFAGQPWFPLDATGPARRAFCAMGGGAGIKACGAVEATPWGNQMIEEFAEAALAGERLGQHGAIDLLAVSYSSNDYVGHAVGPDDPEVRDMAIRTDRLLGQLFTRIEQITGPGNFLAVLTADHGVAPVPEVNQARHMPGGRISGQAVAKTIADALTSRFGPGNWLLSSSATMPYFNLKLMEDHKLERAAVENVAAEAARAFPHIARVFTRTQLMNGETPQDLVGRAVSLGYYPPRSGDLVVVQEPYYLFDATGTTHGTPYEYDAHVPVIFLGPGIKPGRYAQPITPNDIAPTLAEILGLARPAGAYGRVLTEMLE